MKVLITGFGPFPGVPRNPAGQTALHLTRLRRPALGKLDREALILPTTWSSLPALKVAIARLKPDAILMVGVAARRRRTAVEIRAVNAARGVDAEGRRPAPKIARGEPEEMRARAPVQTLAAAIKGAGLACYLSRDAGRYLCNGAYYAALTATMAAGIPVVFIHIPGRDPARPSASRRAFALSQALLALTRHR